MKRYILLIMIILLSFSVLGAGSEWTSFGYDNDHIRTSSITSYSDFLTPGLTSLSAPVGTNAFEQLIGDIDNDGTTETIFFDGNLMYVMSISGGVWVEESSANVGTLDSMPFMEDMDANGYYNIIGSFDDFVKNIEFNGSTINTLNRTYNSSADSTGVGGGIGCSSGYDDFSDWICYMAGENNDLIEYYPQNGTGNSISVARSLNGNGHQNYFVSSWHSPSIADIDLDSEQEIVIVDPNTNADSVVIFDQTDFSEEFTITSGKTYTAINSVITTNLDLLGDYEVCVLRKEYFSGGSSMAVDLDCDNGDGTSFDNVQLCSESGGDSCDPLGMAFVDIDGVLSTDICVAWWRTGSSNDYVSCLETNTFGATLSTLDNILIEGYVGQDGDTRLTAGRFIGDVDEQGLIVGTALVYWNDTSNALSLKDLSGEGLIDDDTYQTADVNNDGFIDLMTDRGKTFFSGLVNDPPTLNNSLNYGGFASSYDFNSPICLNTSLLFEAQNIGGTALGNYENDVDTDQERIVTNCGLESDFTTNLVEGSYDLANPTYSCVYNSTGNFNVRLYIEDDANVGDRTQYNTQSITITVIDGISGSTCNFAGGGIGSSGSTTTGDTTAIDDSIEDTLGVLTGTSDTMKLLLAFVIIIGLVWTTASQGITNPFALSAVALLGVAFVTFFGLLPVYVLILIMVLMVLMLLLSVTLGRSGGD